MKKIYGNIIKIDEGKVKNIDIEEFNYNLLDHRRYIVHFLDENDVARMNNKDKKLFIDRLQQSKDFLDKTIWKLQHKKNYNFDPNDELPF